jgi:pimeloyl-ACP methyl ester carboxylesterase
MADDALAVMDAAGVERAHLFGVSMGGVLVMEMYRRRPDRVASMTVGCSGILSAEKPRMPGWARLVYHTPRWLLKRMRRGKKGIAAYGSAARRGAVEADLAVLDTDRYVVAGVLAQAAAVSAYILTREEVAGWTVPALVLHGDEDSTVPIAFGEELAATLPGAQIVRMQGAGHNFLVARRRETLVALSAFIDGVDRADAGDMYALNR